MKTSVVCLLLVLISFNSFSQKKKNIEDPIYGKESEKAKPFNNEFQNFSIESDEFTQTKKVLQNQILLLYQKNFEAIKSDLIKLDDKVICNFNFNNESLDILCVNTESKVMIKLSNGNVLTLQHIGEVECDKFITINTILSPEDLKILSENQIEKIRCYTTEGYLDFQILDVIPKNYLNKKFFGTYVGRNPKELFQNLIKEIQIL